MDPGRWSRLLRRLLLRQDETGETRSHRDAVPDESLSSPPLLEMTMYSVSICVRAGASDDLRSVTLAGGSREWITVTCSLVPNGDGGMWWELDEGERVKLAEWLGVDHLSPAACHDWVTDLEVQIVERIVAN